MIGNAQAIINWTSPHPDNETIPEIKEKTHRRSLTQNAHYWLFSHQLASVMRLDNDSCHFLMLQRYGVYEVVSIQSGINLRGFFKYSEPLGKGTVNGKEFTHYKIYKRSSQMDSKEFPELLNGLVDECEEQGIVTLTPAEIANLKFIEGE